MSGRDLHRRVDGRFDWPDAALETLRAGVAAGDSARQIAMAIGDGVTRSAVIAKCHRLKLQLGGVGRPAGTGAPAARKPRVAAAKPAASEARPSRVMKSLTAMRGASPKQAAAAFESYQASPSRQRAFDPNHAPEGARLVKLEALRQGECRWPLYEDGPMLFCGCAVSTFDRNGQPDVYCTTHLAMSLPAGELA